MEDTKKEEIEKLVDVLAKSSQYARKSLNDLRSVMSSVADSLNVNYSRMAVMTKEQQEYIDMLMSRERINRTWLNFEKSVEGFHPLRSRLHNETGLKFIYEGMFYNYIELMKNPKVVAIMEKMIADKRKKS